MHFIIVSGTPGTGKSSIASIISTSIVINEISNENKCDVIEVSDFAIRKNVVMPDDTGRETYVIDEEKLKDEILKESKGSKCYLLVTHYPDLFLDDERFYKDTIFTILLRTNPVVLMKRLKEKGWDETKIIENVLAESFNFIAEEIYDYKYDVIEIDTSNLEPEISLDLIFKKLYDSDFGIYIDWLSFENLLGFISDLVNRFNPNYDRIR
ncbi:MAG: AAA family ATPase [Caldisphaera sp.]|jgi:adenylate kinase|nr:AAA family ATPase [Caldisphaera sp.]PMP88113.1 MAG: hypothetical protein C0172_03330 [Caldisphaera sp.]